MAESLAQHTGAKAEERGESSEPVCLKTEIDRQREKDKERKRESRGLQKRGHLTFTQL